MRSLFPSARGHHLRVQGWPLPTTALTMVSRFRATAVSATLACWPVWRSRRRGVAGSGVGGGLYNQAGAVAEVDAHSRIRGNEATTSNDVFGTVTPT
jgi:hypothetical protein